jgi:hypothetical protein
MNWSAIAKSLRNTFVGGTEVSLLLLAWMKTLYLYLIIIIIIIIIIINCHTRNMTHHKESATS